MVALMRRGLKLVTITPNNLIKTSWNGCPDEKGIETSLCPPFSNPNLEVGMVALMRRGLKQCKAVFVTLRLR